MGIKLGKIIPKSELDFDQLRGKKIAVDFSNAVYQFLSSIRQRDGTPLTDSKGNITSHLMGILTRSTNLMEKGIKLVYVFDGQPPGLKLEEKQRREQRKLKAQEKYELALEKEDTESMLKYAKQTTRLDQQMVKESKELIKALGIPIIQSPCEADAQGSYMCEKGDVWAFASSDHDCLLYACPRILPNLTLSQKRKTFGGYVYTKPELISLKDVLNKLNLNHDQLITLAILIGTDYNVQGIPGIGPKKAIKIIQEYQTPEKVFMNVEHNFDWKKIFNIFKNMKIKKSYKLEWKPLDPEKILKLLVEKHEFSKDRVLSILNKKPEKPKKNASLDNWIK